MFVMLLVLLSVLTVCVVGNDCVVCGVDVVVEVVCWWLLMWLRWSMCFYMVDVCEVVNVVDVVVFVCVGFGGDQLVGGPFACCW